MRRHRPCGHVLFQPDPGNALVPPCVAAVRGKHCSASQRTGHRRGGQRGKTLDQSGGAAVSALGNREVYHDPALCPADPGLWDESQAVSLRRAGLWSGPHGDSGAPGAGKAPERHYADGHGGGGDDVRRRDQPQVAFGRSRGRGGIPGGLRQLHGLRRGPDHRLAPSGAGPG